MAFLRWRPSRRVRGLILATLILGLALPLLPLERGAGRARLQAALGSGVGFGAARLDPLRARGLRIDDIAIGGDGWRIDLPRAVARPDIAALAVGALRPRLRARGFVVHTNTPPGLEAFHRLGELLASVPVPDANLRLRGGRVQSRDGELLLEEVALDLQHRDGGAELVIRGRQPVGGRLHARGFRPEGGGLELELFPDRLWLRPPDSLDLPALAAGAEASGHWSTRAASDGALRHRFSLALEDGSQYAAGEAPRLALELRGELATRPTADEPFELLPGSRLRLSGRLGRLHLPGLVAGRSFLLSGPLEAALLLHGAPSDPSFQGHLDLDATHLRLGEWIRKPGGLRARFSFASEGGAQRRSSFELELDQLRLRGERAGQGPVRGSSGWLPLAALTQWVPLLEGRAAGGRLRLADFRVQDAQHWAADLRLDAAAWRHAEGEPTLASVEGAVALDARGLRSRELRVEAAGIPLRIDLAADYAPELDAPRLRFTVRAGEVDLARLGVEIAREERHGELLPSTLRAAAEPPLALLYRRRDALSRIEVERAELHVGRLRGGPEVLESLEAHMALRKLRLDLRSLHFRRRGARHGFAGSVDLDRLFPDVRLAPL